MSKQSLVVYTISEALLYSSVDVERVPCIQRTREATSDRVTNFCLAVVGMYCIYGDSDRTEMWMLSHQVLLQLVTARFKATDWLPPFMVQKTVKGVLYTLLLDEDGYYYSAFPPEKN